MFITELVGNRPVADAARELGASFSSLTQWLAANAIVVDSRVHTRVKRVGGFPSVIPPEWVRFNDTWYRPSCAKPLTVTGSPLPTRAENLAAGRGPRDVAPACALTEEMRVALESLGMGTWDEALRAILGLA